MKKLEDLQVGDEVIIDYTKYKRVGVVIRTTKLYIEVKSGYLIWMYSKKDGRPKGLHGYSAPRILVITDELKAELEEFNRRTMYQNIIRACNMKSLPTDKLEQIYNVIKSEEK